jgi:hypothetical protein
VREAILFQERVHAHLPEAAEVALLVFAVSEGVSAGMNNSFVGLAFFLGAAEAVTLHLAESVLAGL